MRIFLTFLLTIALALGWVAPARAGNTSGGGEGLDFLLLDANGRALSMGGAYTALAADSNALLYNPAGLGRIDDYRATFMHNQFVQGLTHDYFGAATKQGWGFNVNYLHFADIPRTTLAAPEGVGSRFDIGDFAVGAGYGKTVYHNLSLGVGGKFVRETIDSIEAKGFAFDLGALYGVDALPGLTLGLSALNIGPEMRYQKISQKMPTMFRAGAAYAFPLLGNENTASLDMMKSRTDQARIGLGAETVFNKTIAFRGGFNTSNDAGLGITGGIGWIGKSLSIDYAITPFGELGISNSVSFTYRWGGPQAEAARAAPYPSRPEPARAATIEDHFARAQEMIAARSYHQAQEELGAGYALLGVEDSRRVWYHERMGLIALKEEAYDKAESHFTEAIKIAGDLSLSDSHLADSYAGMGFCLVHDKNPTYAAKFFNKALELGASPENRAAIETELNRLKLEGR